LPKSTPEFQVGHLGRTGISKNIAKYELMHFVIPAFFCGAVWFDFDIFCDSGDVGTPCPYTLRHSGLRAGVSVDHRICNASFNATEIPGQARNDVV